MADKKTFYLKTSIAGGVLGLGYIILAYVFEFSFGMYGENGYYYFMGPVDTVAVLLLVVGIFGFDYMLLPAGDTFPVKALRDMSININTVYCIQWTLIGVSGILLTGAIFPEEGLTFVPMTFLAAAVTIVSGLAAHWYRKRKFLSTKPAKIVLGVILVIVTLVSIIGQLHAEPLDMDDYEYMETGRLTETVESEQV